MAAAANATSPSETAAPNLPVVFIVVPPAVTRCLIDFLQGLGDSMADGPQSLDCNLDSFAGIYLFNHPQFGIPDTAANSGTYCCCCCCCCKSSGSGVTTHSSGSRLSSLSGGGGAPDGATRTDTVNSLAASPLKMPLVGGTSA